jgi:hypothetical protein
MSWMCKLPEWNLNAAGVLPWFIKRRSDFKWPVFPDFTSIGIILDFH